MASENPKYVVSQSVIETANSRTPHDGRKRILLSGNWIRPAAKDFKERGRQHADQCRRSNYEALCIVERLRKLGAVGSSTQVEDHGTIFQNFKGTYDIEAAHTLTTTFIFDAKFLHQVKQKDSKLPFNQTFVDLAILLQSNVTYSPWFFNRIDEKLAKHAGFVKLFIRSIESVLKGKAAKEAMVELTSSRQKVLDGLAELVNDRDVQITVEEAWSLMNEQMRKSEDKAKYLADSESLENIVDMYKQGIQIYASREAVDLKAIGADEIEQKVNSGDWTTADEPSARRGKR